MYCIKVDLLDIFPRQEPFRSLSSDSSDGCGDRQHVEPLVGVVFFLRVPVGKVIAVPEIAGCSLARAGRISQTGGTHDVSALQRSAYESWVPEGCHAVQK